MLDVDQHQHSFISSGNARWCSHFGKQLGGFFLTKLNVVLSNDPGVMLLCISPNELKTYIYVKIFTQIVIAALFRNCQNLEAIKMSFNRWMDK